MFKLCDSLSGQANTVLLIAASAMAAIFYCSTAKAAEFSCEAGTAASGAVVDVRGGSHDLRTSPNDKAPRIVNEKATSILGKTQYQSIDSSTQVQMQCENGDWVRVQITKPEWLTYVRGWVKREALAAPRPAGQAQTFIESDIYWGKDTRPHKAMIVKALNRIHREDPRCKSDIDANSVAQSPSRSKPGKPVFFVPCGSGTNMVNVYFSAEDVSSAKAFAAPGHINQTRAVSLCEAYARQNATHPSTVRLSKIMDLAISEHPNGRTSVQSSFTAKNSFNLELNYKIRCLLDENGLIEANVNEAVQ